MSYWGFGSLTGSARKDKETNKVKKKRTKWSHEEYPNLAENDWGKS